MSETPFRIFALFFIAAAVYHFAGLFYPVNSAPVWRHGLFVVINLLFAWGMLKRPAWFIYVFFVLLLQQLYGHGSALLNHWHQTQHLAWIDLAVVIATPVMFTLLLWEHLNKNKTG